MALGQAAKAEPVQLQLQTHIYEAEGTVKIESQGTMVRRGGMTTALGVDMDRLHKDNKLREISAPTIRTISGMPCQVKLTSDVEGYTLGFTPKLEAAGEVSLRTDISLSHDGVIDFTQIANSKIYLDQPALIMPRDAKRHLLVVVTVSKVASGSKR